MCNDSTIPSNVLLIYSDYYSLYLQAIGRAVEGVVTIFLSGIADYARELFPILK
jgi:hypothetical protein